MRSACLGAKPGVHHVSTCRVVSGIGLAEEDAAFKNKPLHLEFRPSRATPKLGEPMIYTAVDDGSWRP